MKVLLSLGNCLLNYMQFQSFLLYTIKENVFCLTKNAPTLLKIINNNGYFQILFVQRAYSNYINKAV